MNSVVMNSIAICGSISSQDGGPTLNSQPRLEHGGNMCQTGLEFTKLPSLPVARALMAPSLTKRATVQKAGLSEKKAKQSKRYSPRKPGDKPKRPLSAYNIFFRSERERIVGQLKISGGRLEDYEQLGLDSQNGSQPQICIDGSAGKVSKKGVGFANLARSIAERWKSLDSTSLAHYEKMALAEKARYAEAMANWKRAQEAKKAAEEKKKELSPIIPHTQLMQERLQGMLLPDSQQQTKKTALERESPGTDLSSSELCQDTCEAVPIKPFRDNAGLNSAASELPKDTSLPVMHAPALKLIDQATDAAATVPPSQLYEQENTVQEPNSISNQCSAHDILGSLQDFDAGVDDDTVLFMSIYGS